MNVDKGCTMHHNACECRQAAMKELVENMIEMIEDFYLSDTEYPKFRSFKERAKELFGDLK